MHRYVDIEVSESAIDTIIHSMQMAGWYYWGPAGGHARTTRDGENSWILRFGRSEPEETVTIELTKAEYDALRYIIEGFHHHYPKLSDLRRKLGIETDGRTA